MSDSSSMMGQYEQAEHAAPGAGHRLLGGGQLHPRYRAADRRGEEHDLPTAGPDEVDDDLVRDMTEALTSFCARLYGRRPARNRAEKAPQCAPQETGPTAPQV